MIVYVRVMYTVELDRDVGHRGQFVNWYMVDADGDDLWSGEYGLS